MAEQLKNFAAFDFSGGIVRNKSPFALEDNELAFAKNVDLDERGRIRKRKGTLQFGDTLASADQIRGLIPYYAADFSNDLLCVSKKAASSTESSIYRAITTQVDMLGGITTATTTITVDDASAFASSGNIEIDGDIIAYSGKTATTFTGVTGINAVHADNAYVHQWNLATGGGGDFSNQGGVTNLGTDGGVYYAQLNDVVQIETFYQGGNKAWTGSTVAAPSTAKKGTMAVYRVRRYAVKNNNRYQVDYTDIDNNASFSDNSNFSVGKNDGEPITCVRTFSDELHIYKTTRVWVYNGYSLTPLEINVGAYNQFVVQQISGSNFTFCPLGVFMFDGRSAQRISDPIKEYLDDFVPTYNAVGTQTDATVVKNVRAMSDDTKYYLYIGGTLGSGDSQLTNPVFVYDTITKSWVVYEYGTTLWSFEKFIESAGGLDKKFLLFGNDVGKTFKINIGNADDRTTPIPAEVIFKAFHLGAPNLYKRFGKLKVFCETPGFNVFYSIDQGDWKQLGEVTKKVQEFKFPADAQGYRCQLRIADNTTTPGFIFNGFIFEDTYGIESSRR